MAANEVEEQRHRRRPSSGERPPQFQYVEQLRKLYHRRRYCELSACVLGFSGILFMLAQNEMLMSGGVDIHADGPSGLTRATGLIVLKGLTSVTTAVLVAVVLVQYATRTEIHKMQNTVPSNTNFFVAQYPLIILELILCGFHVPPGVHGDISIHQFHSSLPQAGLKSCPLTDGYDLVQRGDVCYISYVYPVEALGVFMIVRLYLFARYLRSASSLYSQWVAFVGSLNEINAMRPLFHFKALFKIRPLLLLIPLALINTFLTAAIIRILEHPVQAAFANYWKSVWLAAVTMTATGFGDYYPVTYLGRAFTIISAMSGGILLIALVQSLFFGVLELSPREVKVKYLVDLDNWEQATHDDAAFVIQSAWALYRKKLQVKEERASSLKHLYEAMHRSRLRRTKKPEVTLTLEEQIAEMENAVITRIRRMEEEEASILSNIQSKTQQLAKLKTLIVH